MSDGKEDIPEENFGPPASNLRRNAVRNVGDENTMATVSDKGQGQEKSLTPINSSARKTVCKVKGKQVETPSVKSWLTSEGDGEAIARTCETSDDELGGAWSMAKQMKKKSGRQQAPYDKNRETDSHVDESDGTSQDEWAPGKQTEENWGDNDNNGLNPNKEDSDREVTFRKERYTTNAIPQIGKKKGVMGSQSLFI